MIMNFIMLSSETFVSRMMSPFFSFSVTFAPGGRIFHVHSTGLGAAGRVCSGCAVVSDFCLLSVSANSVFCG